MRSRLVFPLMLVCAAGCGDDTEEGPGITGTVLDAQSKAPIGGAVFAIEKGGAYVHNPDTSKGNPSYVYGGRSNSDGSFTLKLPAGKVGVHVFADGHRYWPSGVDITDGALTDLSPKPEPNLPADVPPTLTGVKLEPAKVAPGGTTKLTVDAKASDAMKAPLSEEILVVLPEALFSRELDPPSPGMQGFGYPDGTYSATLTAPSEPGTYTYYVVASAENCVIAPTVTATLTVE